MTPLEAMAKAHWDSQREGFDHYLVPWEELPKPQQIGLVHDMRAALLALAEVELPIGPLMHAASLASRKIADEVYEDELELAFRSMLRSIAEGER